MSDFSFKYPPELTKSAWDKNKGLMAKLSVGKTDVGAALKALEETFKVAGFADINPFGGLDPLNFKDHVKGLTDGLNKGVTAVEAKLKEVEKVATDAKKAFGDSKLNLKSAIGYLDKILESAKWLKAQLPKWIPLVETQLRNEYSERFNDSNEVKAIHACVETSKKTFTDLLDMIGTAKGTPTIAKFQETFAKNGPHRQLTTTFKTWDQMAAKHFPRLVKNIYTGVAMKEFSVLPGLMDLANEAGGTASGKLQKVVEKGQSEGKVVKGFLDICFNSATKSFVLTKHFAALSKELKKA